ncbi:hypothetical protein AURDEDRAFT_186644 [Auricularia subglabra TFB-10046 SS5]|nr:hypothetical protein AURDEDRAFT_186644 [Auricularia subglabra TFB-10046 SS5]
MSSGVSVPTAQNALFVHSPSPAGNTPSTARSGSVFFKSIKQPRTPGPKHASSRRVHFRPSGEHHVAVVAESRRREPSPGSSSSENVARTVVSLFPAYLGALGAFFFPPAAFCAVLVPLPITPADPTPHAHADAASPSPVSVPLHTPYRRPPPELVPHVLLATFLRRARSAALARPAAGIAFAYAGCRVLLAATPRRSSHLRRRIAAAASIASP